MAFHFRECGNDACRFRYPVAETETADRCPRCGAPATVVATAVAPQPTATAPADAARFTALLDNIRSIHNVGSMFRSADGAGLAHLYLGGITATPAHPKLAKAALGAQETVSWSYHRNGVETAVALRRDGFRLWALEATPQAEPFFAAAMPDLAERPLVLVVGNEKAGVDPGILACCERVFTLPMDGRKRSLNAAVAFGIAAYHLRYALRRPNARAVAGAQR